MIDPITGTNNILIATAIGAGV